MEHNQYTLDQAKTLLQIQEVVDVKQTLLGFIPSIPFIGLVSAWIYYTNKILVGFETPELRLLGMIIFVYALVKMIGLPNPQIRTKYINKL